MRSPRDILAGVQENLADWLGRVADDGGVATISRRRIGNFFSPENLFGHKRVVDKLIPNERTIDIHRKRRRSRHPEVTHSKILYIVPGLIALLGLFLLFRWVLFVPLDDIGFPLLVVLGILGYAAYRFMTIIGTASSSPTRGCFGSGVCGPCTRPRWRSSGCWTSRSRDRGTCGRSRPATSSWRTPPRSRGCGSSASCRIQR